LLTDPARQIWNSFNNRANAGSADAPEAAVNGCLYDRFKSLYTKTATKPSLVIVPARFKSGTLYSQIPSSNADFTVTRDTTARRFTSAGLIASVASGIPRLDYYTSGGVTGCPALLVEPAGTNLCLQSENLDIFPWNPTNTAVTVNVAGTTDPAGGNTADQIFETAASGSHFLAQTMTIVSGTTYVGSIFYKKATGSPDWMQVAFSTTGLAGFANFNLTSGTVGLTGAGCTGRIENYGNGWYRCTLIQTANANGTSGGPVIVFTNNTNSITRFVSYTGNTATSIYAWGAQLETGSVATSYIPTTAGTGSRSADVISVSGAVSGSIGQTEGTIYLEMQADSAGTGANFLIIGDGVNADDFVYLGKNGANLQAVVRSNNSSVVSFTQALTGNAIKAAIAYKGGDSALYVNGSFVASGSTAFTFSSLLPSIGLGLSSFAFAAPTAINRYRAAALYNTRLTNAELALITQP
jgi:hypothetical protein